MEKFTGFSIPVAGNAAAALGYLITKVIRRSDNNRDCILVIIYQGNVCVTVVVNSKGCLSAKRYGDD